jgi:prolyl-tRNA synthetase
MSSGKFHTPDVKSIEELSQFFKIDPYFLVKAVAKKAIYEDREEIVVFFIRGSDNLQETKAQSASCAIDLVDATPEELSDAGLVAGFIGLDSDVKKYVDLELKDESSMICGADEVDYHLIGYSLKDKDFDFVDLVEVKEGDSCPNCGSKLTITKGIEVGHIFQLGTTYSEALNATFLDKNGKSQPYIMGTYGIGVSRLVAVVVEQHHDDKGCLWTKETTPFELSIIISNVKDDTQREFGEELYEKLKSKGIDVILDDRPERFGFKIKDFELLGFPKAVIVGKGLADGEVQIVDRKSLEKVTVSKDDIFEKLMES